jgi:putative acetyltransferase
VTLAIGEEPPNQPDVMALIAALDAYANALYPPESNQLRDPRGWGEVKRMYVRPDQRGRGIGRRVLAEIEAIARGSRLPLLRLETGIHNTEALALYRRSGFAECAPFGDYAPDPLSVFMEKRL